MSTPAEIPSTEIITLTRHVLGEQIRLGDAATGDLTLLLNAIQLTSKFIATNVRRARLINLVGLAGDTNVQGEEQKKLDVLSNDIMVNALRASGKTAVLVSEELDEAIIIEDRYKGKYCVVFDPLDGSSNIDAGVNIGTIFGIYRVVRIFLLFADCTHDALSSSFVETGFAGHSCRRLEAWYGNGCCRLYDVWLFCEPRPLYG
jgi:fructose-1,6-bisphosphatase I